MSKITKVFDLKTRVKIVSVLSEKELDELIVAMAKVVNGGISEKTTARGYNLAKHWLSVAYTGGYDALIESMLTFHYREAIRDGLMGLELDMLDNGKLTMSPPQLVFKR